MVTIDLAGTSVREANERIRRYGADGTDVELVNPDARHHLGVGLVHPIDVRIRGSAGYFCAGLTETVFVLMVWKWLHVSSIAVFCRTALSVFSPAKKDVLYDFLKREDTTARCRASEAEPGAVSTGASVSAATPSERATSRRRRRPRGVSVSDAGRPASRRKAR